MLRAVCLSQLYKSDNPDRRQELFAELKDLLYAYLDPHIGDRFIPLIA